MLELGDDAFDKGEFSLALKFYNGVRAVATDSDLHDEAVLGMLLIKYKKDKKSLSDLTSSIRSVIHNEMVLFVSRFITRFVVYTYSKSQKFRTKHFWTFLMEFWLFLKKL